MIYRPIPNPQWRAFLPSRFRGHRVCGIYIIISPSGRFYIGSAINIRTRWKEHRKALRGGRHRSSPLQRAANKYGVESFIFKILIICDPENLLFYEQIMIDSFKPEYNTSPTAGSNLGLKFGPLKPEHIAKVVAKTTGQRRSPETKELMSISHKERHARRKASGNPYPLRWLGRTHKPESKKKMSFSARHRRNTPSAQLDLFED